MGVNQSMFLISVNALSMKFGVPKFGAYIYVYAYICRIGTSSWLIVPL